MPCENVKIKPGDAISERILDKPVLNTLKPSRGAHLKETVKLFYITGKCTTSSEGAPFSSSFPRHAAAAAASLRAFPC